MLNTIYTQETLLQRTGCCPTLTLIHCRICTLLNKNGDLAKCGGFFIITDMEASELRTGQPCGLWGQHVTSRSWSVSISCTITMKILTPSHSIVCKIVRTMLLSNLCFLCALLSSLEVSPTQTAELHAVLAESPSTDA